MEKLEGTVKLEDIKRCYVDLQIEAVCKNCGEKMVLDLTEQYLSYPIANKKTRFDFYCDNCDNEFSMNGKIGEAKLTIEIDRDSLK